MRPRVTRPLLLVAAVVVALVGVLVVVRDDPVDERREAAAPDGIGLGWRTIAPLPLSPRQGAAVAWTGEEILVWGGGTPNGQTSFDDGARYDPATDRWQSMAEAPIAGRADAVAAWTGDELLVWGGHGGIGPPEGGAAYDPATDQWRRLPDAPIPARAWSEGAWTGTELVVWGGDNPDQEAVLAGASNAADDGAAYDPVTDRWRRLPAAPIEARFHHRMTWTGHEVIVWGGATGDGAGGRTFDDGAAYDPATDTWRALPSGLGTARAKHTQVWTGTEVLVWGGYVDTTWRYDAAAYDPVAGDGRNLGGASQNTPATAVWTGSRLFAWPQTATLDPGTGRWARLPDGPLPWSVAPTMVAAGDDVLVWSIDGEAVPGAAYRLAPATPPPTRLCRHDLDDVVPTYVPAGWDPTRLAGLGGGTGLPGLGHWEGAWGHYVDLFPSPGPWPVTAEGAEPLRVLDHDATLGDIHEGYGVDTTCGFSLAGYGITREQLRMFAEGLVDGTEAFAVWPEAWASGAVEHAQRLEAGGPDWRDDAEATAIRFAGEVLGWRPELIVANTTGDGNVTVRTSDGDGAAVIGLRRNVAGRWWTVSSVWSFGDDGSGSMAIDDTSVAVGLEPGMPYSVAEITYRRGDQTVTRSGPEARFTLDAVPPTDAPGSLLVTVTGPDGSIIGAWGQMLRPGPIAAG